SAVIDSGAATSLITTRLLDDLQLDIDKASNLIVVTANGTRVRAEGEVSRLPINIHYLVTRIPVQVIKSVDKVLILGNDWLKYVNAHLDWETSELTIRRNGRTVTTPVTFEKLPTVVPSSTLGEEPDEDEIEEEYEDEDLFEQEIYYSLTESEEDNIYED